MNTTDRQAFGFCLAGLAATFQTEIDEAGIAGYWMSLSDLPMPKVKKAIEIASRECKFMPKAAELREFAGDMSLHHRAVIAYDHLARAIEHVGGNKSIDFDDKALNATIRAMGGWPAICDTTHDDFHGKKQLHFDRTYKAFASVGVNADQAAYLPGRFEQENVFHGYYGLDKPVPFITGLASPPAIGNEPEKKRLPRASRTETEPQRLTYQTE